MFNDILWILREHKATKSVADRLMMQRIRTNAMKASDAVVSGEWQPSSHTTQATKAVSLVGDCGGSWTIFDRLTAIQ